MSKPGLVILGIFAVIGFLFATGRYSFASPSFGKSLKDNDLSGKKLMKNPLDPT